MKIEIQHAKLLIGAILCAAVALVITFWRLTPHVDDQQAMILPPVATHQADNMPTQIVGNIFKSSREFGKPDAEESPVEPVKQEKPATSYKLLGIFLQDDQNKAIFVSGAEKRVLTVGEELPDVGQITHIERNKVTILAQDGLAQEWLLFPTGNHDKLKDSEKQ
ncbi:hypothetical protein QRC94_002197 [Vibrio vulnificus]|uniref:type II secretion system protein N n=1 Tax=Vibrio vulnificus TaxID=672 RepID=UPI0009B656EA|nr:type II secretion system protein N [Vibrio vulnificus]EGR1512270.1 hypothetical protein [Vibrio vulnificus]EJA3103517.1 hypothetical protein [Vibrio vulnificus]EJC6744713.1 hypothetical protein [Vibrio vulnificus]EJC6819984.1 hypothetical protein [Vibrio vulnificus]EJC6953697.1 hypothetical protein [Vibrio vulnificus]